MRRKATMRFYGFTMRTMSVRRAGKMRSDGPPVRFGPFRSAPVAHHIDARAVVYFVQQRVGGLGLHRLADDLHLPREAEAIERAHGVQRTTYSVSIDWQIISTHLSTRMYCIQCVASSTFADLARCMSEGSLCCRRSTVEYPHIDSHYYLHA